MTFANSHTCRRIKRELPPSLHLPVSYQTLCCRWFPVSFLERCHTRLGNRFTVYTVGMPPLAFFTHPDDISAILSGNPSHLHSGASVGLIAPLVGERSFMLLEDDEHICGRRTIAPAFHQRTVQHHAKLLSDVIGREVASWPLDEAVPFDPRICALTLRLILRAIFGNEDDALLNLRERLMEMLSITTTILLQEPKTRRLPGWHKIWKGFIEHRAAVDESIYNIVRRRRSVTEGEHADLLDMLLAAENADRSSMSDREIRDNLVSMILAGHETTAGEISWAFQLLAHNPQVQRRLAREIDSGIDDDYLTATVHETMRRRPVFLFAIPREVVTPIDIGGCIVGPPARLVACTYLMHHDPRLYPDPYEFRPERFIDEPPGPYTWRPWGGGRKHCLGWHFAMLEVKSVLRCVLADRTILPASKHIERPRWRSATLVPYAGGRVIMRKRRSGSLCAASSSSPNNVSVSWQNR